MTFRLLAASTPGSGVTSEFLSIPWKELTLSQIEKVGSCAEKNLQLLGFARICGCMYSSFQCQIVSHIVQMLEETKKMLFFSE